MATMSLLLAGIPLLVPLAIPLKVKQPQDDWVAAEIVETVTDTFYTSTGIFHSATVDWRVMATCGSGPSSYTVAQYTVPCPEPYRFDRNQYNVQPAPH